MRPGSTAALFLLCVGVFDASAKTVYEVPIDWIRIETHGDYEEGYQTSLDPAKRLTVLIRAVAAGDAGAETWAARQSETMKRQGLKTGPALEQYFGGAGWWYVDWKDGEGEGGRRYFRGPAGSVVEVSIVAREEIFRSADASQFDAFLASFSS